MTSTGQGRMGTQPWGPALEPVTLVLGASLGPNWTFLLRPQLLLCRGSDGPLRAQGWTIVTVSRRGEDARIRAETVDPGGVLAGLGGVGLLGVLSPDQESGP